MFCSLNLKRFLPLLCGDLSKCWRFFYVLLKTQQCHMICYNLVLLFKEVTRTLIVWRTKSPYMNTSRVKRIFAHFKKKAKYQCYEGTCQCFYFMCNFCWPTICYTLNDKTPKRLSCKFIYTSFSVFLTSKIWIVTNRQIYSRFCFYFSGTQVNI